MLEQLTKITSQSLNQINNSTFDQIASNITWFALLGIFAALVGAIMGFLGFGRSGEITRRTKTFILSAGVLLLCVDFFVAYSSYRNVSQLEKRNTATALKVNKVINRDGKKHASIQISLPDSLDGRLGTPSSTQKNAYITIYGKKVVAISHNQYQALNSQGASLIKLLKVIKGNVIAVSANRQNTVLSATYKKNGRTYKATVSSYSIPKVHIFKIK